MDNSGPARHPGIKFSQSGSLLLDAVRFSAALVVLVDHLISTPFLYVHYRSFGLLSHQAVCVFFVLSGFVIRFITVTRVSTVMDYSIDRVSRIYSVAIPALLFTILSDVVAHAIHPSFSVSVPWTQLPVQVLANLTWTAQCWNIAIPALTDGPFWSLSYECIYYALYALSFYRVRSRWLWITLILMIAGPGIAFLYPVWLVGAYACDIYLRLKGKAQGVKWSGLALVALLTVILALKRQIAWFITITDNFHRTTWLTRLVIRYVSFYPRLVNNEGLVPWLMQTSISFYLAGLLSAATITFGLLTLDRYCPFVPAPMVRWTRLIANSTFALYLFHVPILDFVVFSIGHPLSQPVSALCLLVGTVLVVMPISLALDHLKLWMRKTLAARSTRQARRSAHDAASQAS